MKQKILVILDHDYLQKDLYDSLTNRIKLFFGDDYEIVFKLFDPIQTRYDYMPLNIQSAIDSETVLVCMDNYICVIVDGPAAYFWLLSFYNGNLIAINPVLDIYNEYNCNLDEVKELKFLRNFQTSNIICILSNEFAGKHEEYDNAFYDTSVIVAKENLYDIDEFWKKHSTFDQIFQYLVNLSNS